MKIKYSLLRMLLAAGSSILFSSTAFAQRKEYVTEAVPVDVEAMQRALQQGRNAPKANPSASRGFVPKDTAATHEAEVQKKLAGISAAEQKRLEEGQAAAKAGGLMEDYTNEEENTRQVVGSANGIPLFVKENSLQQAQESGVSELWPSGSLGYGLDGSGRTAGVWELGAPRTTHQEFIDPTTSLSKVTFTGTAGLSDHASAVVGVVAAEGVVANSIGASYASPVGAEDRDGEFTEMNALALNAQRTHNHSYGLVAGWDSAAFAGASWSARAWFGDLRISSSQSYLFGRYTQLSADTDSVGRNRYYTLPTWSSGNDRGQGPTSGSLVTIMRNGVSQGNNYYFSFRSPSAGSPAVQGFHNGTTFWPAAGGSYSLSSPIFTVPPATVGISVAGTPGNDGGANGFDSIPDGYGTAKNILTVGATDYSTGDLATFSSSGPTDDGRIKPDLVTVGTNVYAPTSASNTSYFATWAGTSFSAPHVTGAVNLLAQMQEQTWGANHSMSASAYKALLIHTANDLGNTGPDYTYGWGSLEATGPATLIESNLISAQRIFIKEVALANNEEANFTIKATGGQKIKVTAAWTDPVPGTLSPDSLNPTNKMLVNNLDVELYRVNNDGSLGTRYYMWRLDPANPSNNATRTSGDQDVDAKDRNNVEQVDMPSNATTNVLYRVIVKQKAGSTITGDSNGQQRVGLAIAGVKERSDYTFQVTAMNFVFSGGQVVAELTWNAIAGEYYVIEHSPDLVTWTTASAMFLGKKDSEVGHSVPVANLGSGFFRVKTVAPGFW